VGETWDLAIEEALDTASHIMIVMSKTSVQSKNVRDEIDYAVEEKKFIVPIMVEECKPPLRLRRTQYTDFSDENKFDEALDKLMQVLSILPQDTMEIKTTTLDNYRDDLFENVALPEPTLDAPSQHNFPELVVLDGPDLSARWLLNKDKMLLGRGESCDIMIPTHEISREHIAFQRSESGAYTISDLNSRNGTWVNGERVNDKHLLKDADEIVVALKVRLRYIQAMVDRPTAPIQVDAHLITEFLRTGKVHIFLNILSRSVIVNGIEMKPTLSKQQYNLLDLLADKPHQVVGYAEIATILSGETDSSGDVDEVAVDTVVNGLRKRLAEFNDEVVFVETVANKGYKLGDVKVNKLNN
jgi:DNA-binding winged helix-turn-helix (wHTH) protein